MAEGCLEFLCGRKLVAVRIGVQLGTAVQRCSI